MSSDSFFVKEMGTLSAKPFSNSSVSKWIDDSSSDSETESNKNKLQNSTDEDEITDTTHSRFTYERWHDVTRGERKLERSLKYSTPLSSCNKQKKNFISSCNTAVRNIYECVNVDIRKKYHEAQVRYNSWCNGCYCLDNFRFIKRLGCNRNGMVFAAEFVSKKKMCAMKIVNKKPNDPFFEELSLNEKHALQTLSDNLFFVKFYCSFQTLNFLFFVTELVNGPNFWQYAHRCGPLPEKHVSFYAAEIAFALNYLHVKGIIHNDVMLGNILLDEKGHIKLIDFGQCEFRTDFDKKCDVPFLISHYVAPEQTSECPVFLEGYNFSVDWWAFGCVLHQLLDELDSNKHFYPFPINEVENDIDSFKYVFKGGKVQFQNDLSVEAQLIIESFLTILPEERLGCRILGFEEIKSHIFFREIDWQNLEKQQLPPPYVPLKAYRSYNSKDSVKLSDYYSDIDSEIYCTDIKNFTYPSSL